MAKKVIIMARINEYRPRDPNPNVPFTPEEIARTAAECEQAGAQTFAREPLYVRLHLYCELLTQKGIVHDSQ